MCRPKSSCYFLKSTFYITVPMTLLSALTLLEILLKPTNTGSVVFQPPPTSTISTITQFCFVKHVHNKKNTRYLIEKDFFILNLKSDKVQGRSSPYGSCASRFEIPTLPTMDKNEGLYTVGISDRQTEIPIR